MKTNLYPQHSSARKTLRRAVALMALMLTTALAINAQGPRRQVIHPRRCKHSTNPTLIQTPATSSSKGMRKAMPMDTSTPDGLGQYGVSAKGTVASIGEPNIPVIMVEFKDLKFNSETTADKVTRMMNENGYNDEPECVGSVRDYFIDNSDGLFSPKFTVVDKVTVQQKCEYYGGNNSSGDDKNVRALVEEAVERAQIDNIDFTPFLVDGKVPMVIIYYAGLGEHNCFDDDAAKYIWAHFSNYSFTSEGIKFGSYFAGNEWRKDYALDEHGSMITTGEHIDGIGVLIHELMHALGMPDFYPTNGALYETPDYWSIMDYGNYYGDGNRPVGLTAYEKSYLGWLDIHHLDTAQAVTLKPGQAAVIYNSDTEKEYYVLENRQPATWYPTNYGHGMLVMHVDFDKTIWGKNTPNNIENHLRMKVLCANGEWIGVMQDDFSFERLRTNLYAFNTEPSEITTTSTPAWNPYNAGTIEPVYDIRQEGDDIIFSFIKKDISTAITGAQADTRDDGTIYTIDGRRVNQPATPGLYIKNGKKLIMK